MTDNLTTQRDMEYPGNSLHHEMKEMSDSLCSDMRKGFNTILNEMKKTNLYHEHQDSILKWMLAFLGCEMVISISLSIVILVRLYTP